MNALEQIGLLLSILASIITMLAAVVPIVRDWPRGFRKVKIVVSVVAMLVAIAAGTGLLLAQSQVSSSDAVSRVITVNASTPPPGVDSGLAVKSGEHITVTASGRAQYGFTGGCGNGESQPYTDPDGQRYADSTTSTTACEPYYDPNAVEPSLAIGRLLARVGTSGPWTDVGSHSSLLAPTAGELFFLYNDKVEQFSNNVGTYRVSVSVRP